MAHKFAFMVVMAPLIPIEAMRRHKRPGIICQEPRRIPHDLRWLMIVAAPSDQQLNKFSAELYEVSPETTTIRFSDLSANLLGGFASQRFSRN